MRLCSGVVTGLVCAARFSEDKVWYRAVVTGELQLVEKGEGEGKGGKGKVWGWARSMTTTTMMIMIRMKCQDRLHHAHIIYLYNHHHDRRKVAKTLEIQRKIFPGLSRCRRRPSLLKLSTFTTTTTTTRRRVVGMVMITTAATNIFAVYCRGK